MWSCTNLVEDYLFSFELSNWEQYLLELTLLLHHHSQVIPESFHSTNRGNKRKTSSFATPTFTNLTASVPFLLMDSNQLLSKLISSPPVLTLTLEHIIIKLFSFRDQENHTYQSHKGSLLVVQWLRCRTFTAMTQVQSLLGELRSHKLNGMVKKKVIRSIPNAKWILIFPSVKILLSLRNRRHSYSQHPSCLLWLLKHHAVFLLPHWSCLLNPIRWIFFLLSDSAQLSLQILLINNFLSPC